MSLDSGRKPENLEGTPEAWTEHARSPRTRRRRESNPQPQICEANVLTTNHCVPQMYIILLINIPAIMCRFRTAFFLDTNGFYC